MLEAVILDSHPLSLICQRRGKPQADACRQWLTECMRMGLRIYVPEVADYEVRRELIRARKTTAVSRLNRFSASVSGRYLPITTRAMRRAAELWAEARQSGAPTADPQALDGDVILAAQALTIGIEPTVLIVATSNVRHVSRYLPAETWDKIAV